MVHVEGPHTGAASLGPGHICRATSMAAMATTATSEARLLELLAAGAPAAQIAAADAERLGLAGGDPVVLRSDHGRLDAAVFIAEIAPGNLQVHWPEGNVLIAAGPEHREAASHPCVIGVLGSHRSNI